jgi:small-conductance mechanosensitive channel
MPDSVYAETGKPSGTSASKQESLKDVTPVNRPVYLTVVVILGVALLAGVGGWLALVFDNRTMPDGLSVVIGTVAGGLVGLISGRDR